MFKRLSSKSNVYDYSSRILLKLSMALNITIEELLKLEYDENNPTRRTENMGHTKENYTQKGLLKKLYLLDNLKKMIGKEVTVYIDRPLGSKHPKYDDIIYHVNYGYIKEFVAADGEYQDAYVLGIDEPLKEFTGIVYCIVNRTNDIEDKLIVADKNITFSNDQIEKEIAFQEKFFKHKIIK